ncbi:MAG: cysteine hydrolase [Burkholderiaceae bacterium]|jgi:nicotinamidase-related amidase|nr:cysteine hydrolase [Burkholderiaceae bacterium]MCO5104351.1 cysteine hydrolase [Burkholderiaceae bacterium]
MPALERSATVLVVVDMINPMRFPGASGLVQTALPAAHACAALKKKLTRRGCTTVYANDNYGRWRSDFKQLLLACQTLPGARGEIAQLLAPAEDDLTLLKPLHSAFHATPLEHLLAQMHTRELVVVGVATDMCVQLTAMDAYMRGYKVWVPSNCTAAQSQERKDIALHQLRHVFKCSVRKA